MFVCCVYGLCVISRPVCVLTRLLCSVVIEVILSYSSFVYVAFDYCRNMKWQFKGKQHNIIKTPKTTLPIL